MRRWCVAWMELAVLMVAVVATAEESVLLGDFSKDANGWELSLGKEFPGAKGELTREKDVASQDGFGMRMSADFSDGGNYVAMCKPLNPPVEIEELTFSVKGTASAFWIRLTDSAGQTFQQSIGMEPGKTGWQELSLREFGNPSQKGISHWGGSNDGVWRGPAKGVALILHRSNVTPEKNTLWIRQVLAKMEHIPAGKNTQGVKSIIVADFTKDAGEWKFIAGSEFPGAKGSMKVEKLADDPIPQAMRLSADFSGGGRYVGMGTKLPSPILAEELIFQVKTRMSSFCLLLTDSQGQAFQQDIPLDSSRGDWQTISVKEFGNPTRKSIFHWGGANDGVWRGPAKAITLKVNAPVRPEANSILVARIDAKARGYYAHLDPVAQPSSFYLCPGSPATLEWTLSGPCDTDDLAYDIVDYEGKFREKGVGSFSKDGTTASATLKLPSGYYEIVFRKMGYQSFGVISLPEFKGLRDSFFAVDGAFSYFEILKNKELRRSYLSTLARCGIGMQRERFGWNMKQMAESALNYPDALKEFRREAAERGIDLLENFCSTDARRPIPYPTDLLSVARAWRQMKTELGTTAWRGTEVWNEPDLFAGGGVPGDSYTALLRAVRYCANAHAAGAPILGGVFNHVKKYAFDTYALNGLLESSDVFAYHDYHSWEETEEYIAKLRSWCGEYGQAGIPFWMTEAGSSWARGPGRPPRAEAAKSAKELAMKAIEDKACGIARHFAFLLIYFDEGAVNWGMHGREHTPLRGMAAYAAVVHNLATTTYIGDLKVRDPAVRRARVFAREGGEEAVVALCAGGAAENATIELDIPVLKTEGIDGRELSHSTKGRIPVPDGVSYLFVKLSDIKEFLDRDTRAAALCATAVKGCHMRSTPSPIVVQPDTDPAQVGYSPKGYYPKDASTCVMRANVYNLAKEATPFSFVL